MAKKTHIAINRPFWLTLFVLWILGLGIISGWRSLTWWQERSLIVELDSTFSPLTLSLMVFLSMLCGMALIAAATGLWWKKEWARKLARLCVPGYFILVQVYLWLFVRSGLWLQRRWIALFLAVLGTGVSVVALTWSRTRRWLGLFDQN